MLALLLAAAAADPDPKDARTALQPFGVLVGSWKCSGTPEGGTREERAAGLWGETVAWEWRFDKADAALVGAVTKGKHFKTLELRYLAGKKLYELKAAAADDSAKRFAGPLTVGKGKEQILTLDRTDDAKADDERLVLTLLHANRYLLRFETKPAAVAGFTRKYQVGATKEGEPFAAAPTGPECVVTGGQAKIPVTHNGKTYYVCCSGCKDAFKENPEKYVAEYEAKRKK